MPKGQYNRTKRGPMLDDGNWKDSGCRIDPTIKSCFACPYPTCLEEVNRCGLVQRIHGEKQAQIVRDYRSQGYKNTEIAKLMEISTAQVKRYIRRIKREDKAIAVTS